MLKKPSIFTQHMVWLWREDELNSICLTEGYLPDGPTLDQHVSKLAASYLDENTPVTALRPPTGNVDQTAAWLFTAYGRICASELGYQPQEVPLETWVLTPSTQRHAAFWKWCSGLPPIGLPDHPSETHYRLFLHRHPRIRTGPATWGNLWQPASKALKIRQRSDSFDTLRDDANRKLEDVLKSLKADRTTVNETLKLWGHPYCHCADPHSM